MIKSNFKIYPGKNSKVSEGCLRSDVMQKMKGMPAMCGPNHGPKMMGPGDPPNKGTKKKSGTAISPKTGDVFSVEQNGNFYKKTGERVHKNNKIESQRNYKEAQQHSSEANYYKKQMDRKKAFAKEAEFTGNKEKAADLRRSATADSTMMATHKKMATHSRTKANYSKPKSK